MGEADLGCLNPAALSQVWKCRIGPSLGRLWTGFPMSQSSSSLLALMPISLAGNRMAPWGVDEPLNPTYKDGDAGKRDIPMAAVPLGCVYMQQVPGCP